MRNKLLRWLLIPLFCLGSLSTLVAFQLATNYANESYDAFLANSAFSIAARVSRKEDGVVVADLPPAAQAILRHNGQDRFYYQIVDSSLRRVAGDAILPSPREPSYRGVKFRYFTINGSPVRMCRVPIRIGSESEELWVQVAETLNSRRRLQQQIFFSIILPQAALAALAGLSVWIGITKGLAPLDKLGVLLKSRSSPDLSPVDMDNPPTELKPVIDALNELFCRVNKHVQSQRLFVSNAAHQLRTPLTAINTYLEYAERINENKSLAHVLTQMKGASESTARMIDKLLKLARTEAPRNVVWECVDLCASVRDVAVRFAPQALKHDVDLQVEIPSQSVLVRADRGDIEEMVTNIIDNAIRYAGSNGSVWLRVADAEPPVFTVEDDGAGIPDQEKSKIFERFYRIQGTQGSGCGLGLSIVREIAASNNATIEVLDRAGGGTTFRVAFAAER